MRNLRGGRHGTSVGTVALLVVAVALCMPSRASADSLTLDVRKFKPSGSTAAERRFEYLGAVGGTVVWWAPVKLPAGATITKLGHWYWRVDTCAGFAARLLRYRRDVGMQTIAQVAATSSTGPSWDSGAAWETSTTVDPARSRVGSTWRYIVEVVTPGNGYCKSNGVKVFFSR